jgi:hypothetical protein
LKRRDVARLLVLLQLIVYMVHAARVPDSVEDALGLCG